MPSDTNNKFCSSTDLTNEASVESFFVLRLLSDLGYEDAEIKTKEAIRSLSVPKGRDKELYKPDYLLVCRKKPRWLIDAKSTSERVENYTYQCAGYALEINKKYGDRPLRYYMLTNGLLTRVYVWDQEEAILSLRFGDFADGNPKYEALHKLLAAVSARLGWEPNTNVRGKSHTLTRPTMDAVKRAFLRCHKIIWKAEKMGPQAAFVEFAKLLFVKLWEDRRLRDNPAVLEMISRGEPLPAAEVRFSTRWVEDQEANDPNPVDALLFRQLVESLEIEIARRRRKRIFESQERLRLSSGTAKRVVKELENYYLFGIDEDLNGRMFEAFLTATMRGQALGQFFTPRSIVKMMTRLARLHAGPGEKGIDRVLDACCGTGGFLIEALTEMRRQIWDNQSLTKNERDTLLEEVANQAIFGIDAGRDPAIARIARINMYLHGDGGSRVYMADALRQPPEPSTADSPEVKDEVRELQELLENGPAFDVVLTNPPFSMDYSVNVEDEKKVLDTYDLTSYEGKKRRSLRSSIMFLERYSNLLRPGGRILTVIDDSVLAGDSYDFVRNFIRERFVIRGIISLHGDAFQRSGARTKTSVLYLIKRSPDKEEDQPAAFVYESGYIGLDDVVPKTPVSDAEIARQMAVQEIDEIVSAFNDYLNGKPGTWLVPAEKLQGRLDAKYLKPWSTTQLESTWRTVGATSIALGDIVEPTEEPVDIIPDQRYTFIRITYSGRCERGETRLGSEITYSKIFHARAGDVVISGLGAVYKAICVLPADMEDLLISSEFLVLRPKVGLDIDTMYLWSVLRSPAIVAEWLSSATGLARHRLDWNILKSQRIPLISPSEQHEVGDLLRASLEQEIQAVLLQQRAEQRLANLDLATDAALDRLAKAKPPQ